MAKILSRSVDKKRVVVEGRNGQPVTLLTLKGKLAKASAELKNNCRYTNDGRKKLDLNGNEMSLTPTQKAFCSGMLSQASESAIAHCAAPEKKSKALQNKRARWNAKKGGN